MKQLFLLPVLFSSLAVQGQANKPAKKTREIFIGVNFSPDYSSRKLKNNNGNAYNDVIIDQRNGIETAKLGFTTGLDLFITVSKLVGLEAGVQYSNKGYQTKKQNLVFGFPDPALPTTSKFIYSYQFIDIPLKINFTAGKKRLQFISSTGFTTNIFIKGKQTEILEYSGGKTEKKKRASTFNNKKIGISPMISLGINYKINNKMYFRIEPTFRYGILKINDDPITAYLWNAGLNTGFYYALK